MDHLKELVHLPHHISASKTNWNRILILLNIYLFVHSPNK